MALILAFFVITLASTSYAANILAIIPSASYSHQIVFVPLWRELSLRGHSITVITSDPINDKSLVNISEIDVSWTYKFFVNITQNADTYSMWNLPSAFSNVSIYIAKEQLSYKPIRSLLEDDRHFDVVLVEHYYPEFLGFAVKYNCPKVLISSLDPFAHIHYFLGNPSHPVVYPELGTPFYGALDFKKRVTSALYDWYLTSYYLYKTYHEKEELLHAYFDTNESLIDLLYDVDLMIINVNPVLQRVRAVGPTTVNMGGYRPTMTPFPLSKDLKDFLDNANDGFVYFSLGSNIKSKELGTETLNSIISALSEIPYKVLWKFEADTLVGKPKNVKLIKWAPQQEILSHSNIKAFVTQGGLQSMEEGIYCEVPFVVIPFFGDQDQNAALMEAKGIGKIVRRKPIVQKEDLKAAILEVIQNPSYKVAVQKLKRLALDTPMTGLEKAVWWTEYVIRNNGTKHLRNPIVDLPLYQYWLLDVIGFLVLVVALVIGLIVVGLKLLLRLLRQYLYADSIKLKKQQ